MSSGRSAPFVYRLRTTEADICYTDVVRSVMADKSGLLAGRGAITNARRSVSYLAAGCLPHKVRQRAVHGIVCCQQIRNVTAVEMSSPQLP